MVKLYGQTLSRPQVAERSGMLSQFAGVRLMTLDDGVERGVRMLEFRTGSGLRFTALVDRALDIADCEFNGRFNRRQNPKNSRLLRRRGSAFQSFAAGEGEHENHHCALHHVLRARRQLHDLHQADDEDEQNTGQENADRRRRAP